MYEKQGVVIDWETNERGKREMTLRQKKPRQWFVVQLEVLFAWASIGMLLFSTQAPGCLSAQLVDEKKREGVGQTGLNYAGWKQKAMGVFILLMKSGNTCGAAVCTLGFSLVGFQ